MITKTHHTTTVATFSKGDLVCIVHYGADPTYSNCARPKFVVAENVEVVRWDVAKGKCRFKHGTKVGCHSEIRWFQDRMFTPGDTAPGRDHQGHVERAECAQHALCRPIRVGCRVGRGITNKLRTIRTSCRAIPHR